MRTKQENLLETLRRLGDEDYCNEYSLLAYWHAVRDAAEEIKRQRDIILGFYDAIAHGDDEHRAWLKDVITKYLNTPGKRDHE